MLSAETLQVKLEDLRRALAVERQHRFINIQGRKQSFAAFVGETLQEVSRALLGDQPDWEAAVARFQDYPHMDVGSRMHALEALEALLARDFQGERRKTATRFGEQALHEMPVQFVKGVGPRLAKVLALVGVHTVEDLLYYFPRRYLDYHQRVRIAELQEGQEVTVLGTIQSVTAYNAPNKNIAIVQLTIADETGVMGASWFYGKSSQAVLESHKSRFAKGTEVMISGKVKWDSYKRRPAIDRPQVEVLSYQDQQEEAESLHVGRIVPVYSLVEGLNLRALRRAIYQTLQDTLETLRDPLPAFLQQRYQLIGLQDALQQIHFPETPAHYEAARRRLVFDELFYVQTRLALVRAQYKQSAQGLSLQRQPGQAVDRFLDTLPFRLTGAQQRVFDEICQDLASAEPMYRMLQGDVGSGKTVVALLTLLVAVENGYQGALMAPTEILAEQHYRRFVEWLTPLGLKTGLFVGKAGARERRELRRSLLNGQIHIAVGTHALIQDDVAFHRLGVVVVDEQHRFGVRQRTLLKAKGDNPEMLTMTATPIPRSLAMTIHGDLDVSVLDELPPGRTPIRTALMTASQHKQAYSLIRQEVVNGRQAYIVFPLIEESESLAAKAATTEAEHLRTHVFPELRIGLLHGKLKPEEKDAVMSAFARGETQILVATTVVEVGVDVPNATVMVIENADRFGLAQLHQLRGRVGRGSHQSYCLLVSQSRSEETLKRLNILVETEDGFVIAEKDLEIRGPGEFLGTRQSGLPDFVLADLIQDKAILDWAQEAATEIVQDPRTLMAHPDLQKVIFQKTDNLFSVLGSG